MYNDVAGISIEECCFKDNKDTIFFPGETDRMSIVYGKNGSDKSTMAEGFRNIMGLHLHFLIVPDSVTHVALSILI